MRWHSFSTSQLHTLLDSCTGRLKHGKRNAAILAAAACLTALLPTRVSAQHPTWDARGFAENRPYFSRLPLEHIDPLTGNLLLTFTDLVLPGNAGFDLIVQRTYNSKIYLDYNGSGETIRDDSWAGIGWTLHFGRVLHGGNPADASWPIIELPDGSAHQAYPYSGTPPSGCSPCYVTKEFWIYDKDDYKLTLPNGTTYIFNHAGPPVGATNIPSYYATRIEDTFGNYVTVNYMSGAGVPADGIESVVQNLGSQTRTVTFTITDTINRSLASMSYNGRTWTYGQTNTTDVGKTLLTSASPPVGTPWTYSYNTTVTPRYELTRLTTPNGGTIDYQYQNQVFHIGVSYPTTSRAVSQRTTGGRSPSGTWTYSYEQGAGNNVSIITGPSNTVQYSFVGVGTYSTQGAAWRVGLPSSITTSANGNALQTESVSYIASQPISTVQIILGLNVDNGVFVPLLSSRTITRGSATFTTANSYHTSNFNDYGRPYQVSENGQLSRTSTRTFDYGFSGYIVDKVESEVVSVGGESFTTSYSYNHSNGFLASTSIYGVNTNYGEGSGGNVTGITDARGNHTTLTYSNGVLENVITPEYTISRTINLDGTISSETRSGQVTSFLYDDLQRITRVTPTIGNSFIASYDNTSGTSMSVTRGPSYTSATLDGFGRVTTTIDAVGVRRQVTFDAEGRKTFESYPFTGTAVGTSFQYDGLARLIQSTNPDGSTVGRVYNGTTVTVTDEDGHPTTHVFRAFGDPDEVRLSSVTDPSGEVVTYGYNALGSLTSATQSGTSSRSWVYNTKNQLTSETHPESGTVIYTRDAVGNLSTRRDAAGQIVSFTYDGNNRVRFIDYPGSADDTTIAYDDWDNQTSLTNGAVATTFVYEGGRRLTSRSDAFGTLGLTTTLHYDSNDNLDSITYPSGKVITYSNDAEGRPTSASDGVTTYASSVTYHPLGAIASYQAGNGVTHSVTRDTQQRVATVTSGSVLDLTYGYDLGGNVTSITDARPGMNRTFTYDALDRLTAATGWGGASYSYDNRGNRTSKTVGGRFTSYTYEFTNRLSSSSGDEPAQFHYDSNGNLQTDGTFVYSYAPTNMQATATIGGSRTSYGYDGGLLRVFKKDNDGTEHYFAHGPGGELIAEHTRVGNSLLPVREYIYVGNELVSSIETGLAISVAVATPANGQSFPNTSSITLSALPTVPAGLAVTSVQYFQGGTLVGSSSNSTNNYAVSWTNLPSVPGQYSIIARVIVSDGRAAASSPIFVTLTTPDLYGALAEIHPNEERH